MKVTFNLMDNATWQDGTPFNAMDVKFCVDYLKSNNVTNFESITNMIEEVKTPDDNTVELYLNQRGYRLIYGLSWLTFLPEHIWSSIPDYKTARPLEEDHPAIKGLTKLVGNGPFIYTRSSIDREVILAWNPTYLYSSGVKPGLVQRITGNRSVTLGDTLEVRYNVSDFTYARIEGHHDFIVKVLNLTGATVMEVPASSVGTYYQAAVNTIGLTTGNYTCVFQAQPYGVDSYTFSVDSKATAVPGNQVLSVIFGAIVALIIFELERAYGRGRAS